MQFAGIRIIVVSLLLCFSLASLPGCGSRYINMKTIESPPITSMSHTIELVRDQGSNAADEIQAQALRRGAFDFYADRQKDLEVYPAGTTNGPVTINLLAESLNVTGPTYPNPTEIRILTTSPHDLGVKISSGYAEIRFGQKNDPNAKIFTTDAPDTFFELELSNIFRERGQRVASGKFSAIARNKNNLSDPSRLLIMDGSFIAKIKN